MFAFFVETMIDFFNGAYNENAVIKSYTDDAFYPLNFEKFMTGYKMRHVYTKTNPVTETQKLNFEQQPDRYVQGWYLLASDTGKQGTKNYTYIPEARCRKMIAYDIGKKILN